MLKNVILFCISIFFIYGALNYSGFCFKKMRYISDEEKIKIAIELVSSGKYDNSIRYYYNENKKRIDRWERTVPYKNVSEFLEKNQYCYTLIPKEGTYYEYEDDPPTFFMKISGKYNYAVRVRYIYKYISGIVDENKNELDGVEYEKSVVSFFEFSNCGKYCYSCFSD